MTKKKKVLICTESPEILPILKHAVDSLENAKADYVKSGREVIDHLLQEPVDLLICDNRMGRSPSDWGSEIVKEVRERWPKTKILFMSGDETEGENPACDRFLHKPFGMRALTDAVKSLLNIEQHS